MSRRPLVLALAAAVVASAVPLSGAVFTSSSRATGSVRASIDWTSPDVAITSPGNVLTGTTNLTAIATDRETAIAAVTIEIAPTGSGAWNAVCTGTVAPYTCQLVTTSYADGRYDLRATAQDTEGNIGVSAVLTSVIIDNQGPQVQVDQPATALRGTTAQVTATASDAGTGVASVRIQRSLADAGVWTDLCTDTTAPYACTWNTTTVASDYYDLRAIATDVAGNVTVSATATDVIVDNVAPTVTMVDPGTPLRGSVNLTATAADGLSGIATVTYQYAPAGTTNWLTACVITGAASPYTCRWTTTTVADATYDLRAIATDGAGNTATSATIKNRVIDNSQSSVSVQDPGAFLSGTVTINADAFSLAGVASVRIQRAPSGSSTWTDLCTDTMSPYGCTWNTTTVADGLYDLRAILVDGNGSTVTSAVVTQRRVDNTPVRGVDVQSVNGGGTVGRIEANDQIIFSYSEQMKLTTIMAGWSGGAQAVVVRVRDGGLVGGGNVDDTLDVFTTSALTTPVRLGSVNLRGDFLKGGRTSVWNATMTQVTNANGTTSVTLTIGTLVSGTGGRTSGSNAAMIWTPSNVATDLTGNACSTAPVSESGALDKDF